VTDFDPDDLRFEVLNARSIRGYAPDFDDVTLGRWTGSPGVSRSLWNASRRISRPAELIELIQGGVSAKGGAVS
jgi:hypothetical protein